MSQHIHSAGTANWFVTFFPVTQLSEFMLGMVLGMAMRSGWRLRLHPLAALGILVVAVMSSYHVPAGFSKEAVTVVPFALLIASVATYELAGRESVLGSWWLVRLGEWSFAFYMIHALAFRALVLVAPDHPSLAAAFGLVLVVFVVSTVSAGVIYRYYEMPLERRFRTRRRAGGGRSTGAARRDTDGSVLAAPDQPAGATHSET